MFVRTQRLLLRPGWPEDARALFEAITDEGVVRNLAQAPWPYTPEHAEGFLSRRRDPLDVFCLIFVRTDAEPVLAGGIGLARLPAGEHELGYWLARRHWGKGIATEAARGLLAAARNSLRLRRVVSGHFLDNPASGRVLAKLGFRPTGEIVQRYSAGRGEDAPCRLFELDLAEEEAATAETACAMAA
jgi:RimJ/RimL family protein N-acetyltransferase